MSYYIVVEGRRVRRLKVWKIIEHDTGDTITYLNDAVHSRFDNPAIISKEKFFLWFKEGLLHNTYGPAVIDPNNRYEYWLKGIQYSHEEWKRLRFKINYE